MYSLSNLHILESLPPNMADTTTRFQVGEIYTIEANGPMGWNTYELEVVKLTKHYVDFSYAGLYNSVIIRNKKYVSAYDDTEYAVIKRFRRRDSNIDATIMSGNFDLQPQIPISELSVE